MANERASFIASFKLRNEKSFSWIFCHNKRLWYEVLLKLDIIAYAVIILDILRQKSSIFVDGNCEFDCITDIYNRPVV